MTAGRCGEVPAVRACATTCADLRELDAWLALCAADGWRFVRVELRRREDGGLDVVASFVEAR